MVREILIFNKSIRILTPNTSSWRLNEFPLIKVYELQISSTSHAHVSIFPPLKLPADPRWSTWYSRGIPFLLPWLTTRCGSYWALVQHNAVFKWYSIPRKQLYDYFRLIWRKEKKKKKNQTKWRVLLSTSLFHTRPSSWRISNSHTILSGLLLSRQLSS